MHTYIVIGKNIYMYKSNFIDFDLSGGDNIDRRRLAIMSEAILRNPDWLIKLSSSSINISTSLLKLVSYKREISEENKKDDEFYVQMKKAFQESAEIDLQYAELFTSVSHETDCITKGDENGSE